MYCRRLSQSRPAFFFDGKKSGRFLSEKIQILLHSIIQGVFSDAFEEKFCHQIYSVGVTVCIAGISASADETTVAAATFSPAFIFINRTP